MPTSKSDYKADIQAIKTGNSVGTGVSMLLRENSVKGSCKEKGKGAENKSGVEEKQKQQVPS